MLTRKRLLLIGVQASLGAPAALSADTHAILVEAVEAKPVDAKMVGRNVLKPTLAPEQQIHAGHLWEVTFTAEVKGSGALGVAPEFGPALRACGLSETTVVGESVTYQPASDDHELATVEFYLDGKRIRLRDCRGNVTLNKTAGSIAKLSFTLKGHQDGEITDVPIPTASYQATVPVPSINLQALLVAGHASEIATLSLDLGNEVKAGGSIRSANGFSEVRIASRNITGQVDPEDTAVAVKNWVKEWQDGAVAAITTGAVGSAPGNRWQLTLPRTYWTDAQPGDREGTAIQQMSFAALETTGDDELTLTFT